jgi:hypothetical protein
VKQCSTDQLQKDSLSWTCTTHGAHNMENGQDAVVEFSCADGWELNGMSETICIDEVWSHFDYNTWEYVPSVIPYCEGKIEYFLVVLFKI